MSVEIRPDQTRRDRRAFVELPFGLYANDPVWIPPLRLERRLYFNPRFNPFLQRADVQLLLAERDGRVVGRISAHVDPRFNEQHEAPWGWFGFLEVEGDAEALDGLLDAAEGGGRGRGVGRMGGPGARGGPACFTNDGRRRLARRGFRAPADGPPELQPPVSARAVRGGGP